MPQIEETADGITRLARVLDARRRLLATPFDLASFVALSDRLARSVPVPCDWQPDNPYTFAADAETAAYADWKSYARQQRRLSSARVATAQQGPPCLDSDRISQRYRQHAAVTRSLETGFEVRTTSPAPCQTYEVSAWPGMVRAANITPRQSRLRGGTGGGLRGSCNGFSIAAQRRMKQTLGRLDFRPYRSQRPTSRLASAVFVTLTYPAYFPADHSEVKRHLNTLCVRLQRRRWFRGLVWKYELQRRGAPHLHCILFLHRDLPIGQSPRMGRNSDGSGLRGWFARAWHDIIFPPDLPHRPEWMRHHLYFGHRVEPIYNPGGGRLAAYLSKYMGKSHGGGGYSADHTTTATGRCWGVRGELPFASAATFLLYGTRAEAVFHRRLRRWGRNSPYLSRSDRHRRTQYIYGDGYQFTQILRGIPWWWPGWNHDGSFTAAGLDCDYDTTTYRPDDHDLYQTLTSPQGGFLTFSRQHRGNK